MFRKFRRLPLWSLLEALIFIAAVTIIDVFDQELKDLIGSQKTALVKWLVIGIAVLIYLVQQTRQHHNLLPRKEMVLKIIELHLTAIYGNENLSDFRVYVLLPDASNRLRMEVRYNMNRSQPDYHLTLAIAAGTAGRAYHQQRTITADLNVMTPDDLHLSLKEANQMWQEIQSMLSTPMWDESGKLIGVVTFDSTRPIEETGFDQQITQAYLETCAALLADGF